MRKEPRGSCRACATCTGWRACCWPNARIYIDSAPKGPFDGATCLLTLHFLPPAERLKTLQQIHLRLKPGASLVVTHHSFPGDDPVRDRWLSRNAAFAAASGVPVRQAEGSIAAIKERLPVLSPAQDVDLLREAGFTDIESPRLSRRPFRLSHAAMA